jgi:hypothetical protein
LTLSAAPDEVAAVEAEVLVEPVEPVPVAVAATEPEVDPAAPDWEEVAAPEEVAAEEAEPAEEEAELEDPKALPSPSTPPATLLAGELELVFSAADEYPLRLSPPDGGLMTPTMPRWQWFCTEQKYQIGSVLLILMENSP